MPLSYDDFKYNSQIGSDRSSQIRGLETFRKSLEKDFFSKVNISPYGCFEESDSLNLVIEMYCNLALPEMLSHFNKGNWGASYGAIELGSPFLRAFSLLRDQNSIELDVEEFTIFLNDTSIIMNKIYSQSIPSQIENILVKMGYHFVHFTKGLLEMPYEIYLPVFMEKIPENNPTLLNMVTGNYCHNDYFQYWGLYFESQEEAVIYDLENKSIIEGDLFMLSH